MIIQASAHQIPLADKSVHAVVTSPPYFGLRRYAGQQEIDWPAGSYAPCTGAPACIEVPAMRCGFGNEDTVEAYIWHMLLILRECRRVLRDDGVLWINLGDSYAGSSQTGGTNSKEGSAKRKARMFKAANPEGVQREVACDSDDRAPEDYPGNDWSLKNPCDASRVSSSRRKSRKDTRRAPIQAPSPSGPNLERMVLPSAHLPTLDLEHLAGRNEAANSRLEHFEALEREPLGASQESTPDASSPLSQADQISQFSTGFPSSPMSSFEGAPTCARMAGEPSLSHFAVDGVHQTEGFESDTRGNALIDDASAFDTADTAFDSDSYQDSTTEHRQAVELSSGNLLGVPHRVMLAAQADGWTVRNDCVWAKRAPMPESLSGWRFQDGQLRRGSWRHTRAHEFIFQLTKGMGYFSDGESVKEAANCYGDARHLRTDTRKQVDPLCADNGSRQRTGNVTTGRNPRSVLTPPPSGYSGQHFAVFPCELIRPLILASVPRRCCPACGTGWAAVVETKGGNWEQRKAAGAPMRYGADSSKGTAVNRMGGVQATVQSYRPTCACAREDYAPGVVLDPFAGSGTTGEVARECLVNFIGLDISFEYLSEQAAWRAERQYSPARMNESPLFAGLSA